MLTPEHIQKLWDTLGGMFPNWKTQMGSTDKNNVWYRGLKDLELWQISAGLTRLKDSNESYNPSLPYFRGLCTKAEPPRIKKHESLSAPERTEEQKQNAKKVLDMAKSILKSTGAR